MTIVEGSQAPVLAVVGSAAAGEQLTYQWYRDGEAIEGATDATYAVDTTEVGTHTYSIEVINTLGVETNTATARSADAVVKVTADKSKLEKAVSHTKQAVAGLNESDYTAESWKALQDALTVAENVMADENATQDQVDEATSSLMKAYQGLQKADNGNAGKDDGGNNGNAGENNGGNGNAGDSNGGNASNGAATDGGNGAAAGNGGSNGSANSGNAAAATSNGGKLTQTGDAAPFAPVVGGGLIAALGAIISAAAMRLRKRNE